MEIKKIMAAAVTAGTMLSFVPMVSLADETGWQNMDGLGWRYYTDEDQYVEDDWEKIDGKWYYFDSVGFAVIGAENYTIDGKDYDFDASGVCKDPYPAAESLSGWYRRSRSQIIYDQSFEYSELKYDWYYYGADGKAVSGWQKIAGKWYYFDLKTGVMYTCDDKRAKFIDDELYYFKDNGELVTGWYYNGEGWVYARSNGILYSYEWLNSGGKWYYFSGTRMLSDAENYWIDDIYYSFDSNGVCINPGAKKEKHYGWFKMFGGFDQDYEWFYFDSNGERYTGWHQIGGKWYYFATGNGIMYHDRIMHLDGKAYCFRKSGEMAIGWYETTDSLGRPEWFYCGPDGVVCKGWKEINGKWYYFSLDNGLMYADRTAKINGKRYRFSSDGVLFIGWSSYETKGKQTYWFYSDSDGVCYESKWLNYKGSWYYFDEYGQMVADIEEYDVNGKPYDFDENGVCLNP